MIYWNLKNYKTEEAAPPCIRQQETIVTTAAIGINKIKPKDAANTFWFEVTDDLILNCQE